MQTRLFEKARAFRDETFTYTCRFTGTINNNILPIQQNGKIPGWILAGWCGDDACEEHVKEETKFTTRNIPFNPPTKNQLVLIVEKKRNIQFGLVALINLRLLNIILKLSGAL